MRFYLHEKRISPRDLLTSIIISSLFNGVHFILVDSRVLGLILYIYIFTTRCAVDPRTNRTRKLKSNPQIVKSTLAFQHIMSIQTF